MEQLTERLWIIFNSSEPRLYQLARKGQDWNSIGIESIWQRCAEGVDNPAARLGRAANYFCEKEIIIIGKKKEKKKKKKKKEKKNLPFFSFWSLCPFQLSFSGSLVSNSASPVRKWKIRLKTNYTKEITKQRWRPATCTLLLPLTNFFIFFVCVCVCVCVCAWACACVRLCVYSFFSPFQFVQKNKYVYTSWKIESLILFQFLYTFFFLVLSLFKFNLVKPNWNFYFFPWTKMTGKKLKLESWSCLRPCDDLLALKRAN